MTIKHKYIIIVVHTFESLYLPLPFPPSLPPSLSPSLPPSPTRAKVPHTLLTLLFVIVVVVVVQPSQVQCGLFWGHLSEQYRVCWQVVLLMCHAL